MDRTSKSGHRVAFAVIYHMTLIDFKFFQYRLHIDTTFTYSQVSHFLGEGVHLLELPHSIRRKDGDNV